MQKYTNGTNKYYKDQLKMNTLGNQDDIEILEDSDRFWDRFWQHIDKAKDVVFIATYDMDHKLIAAITLEKLERAARRGVRVIVIIDDLNPYASTRAVKQLEDAGGVVIKNNPFARGHEHALEGRYQKFFNRNH